MCKFICKLLVVSKPENRIANENVPPSPLPLKKEGSDYAGYCTWNFLGGGRFS